MELVLIDHYDSFTFNVIDWLRSGTPSAEVTYVAVDDAAGLAALLTNPRPLVLSPGPKAPRDQAPTLAVVQKLLGQVPILGICLGHQILAHLAGAAIIPAADPFHGTTRQIKICSPSALFKGLPSEFLAATYNSLVVHGEDLSSPWRVTARDTSGEVQALTREVAGEAPAYGLQFHPESFLSEGADVLRSNWLEIVQEWEQRKRGF